MDFKLPKVAPEGNIFIIIFAAVTLLLFILSSALGVVGIVLTLWCVAFFRDPERITPQSNSLVIAPADGMIIKMENVMPPYELGFTEEMLKISIFMNVFNVHINRTPSSGLIEKIIYHPGKFFNASLDKASTDNERMSYVLKTEFGPKIGFVQIAGLVARRIVKFIGDNTEVEIGQKIGLIRFGSRVDVYLPKDITPFVEIGQTTIAGETILADFDCKCEKLEYKIQDRAK